MTSRHISKRFQQEHTQNDKFTYIEIHTHEYLGSEAGIFKGFDGRVAIGKARAAGFQTEKLKLFGLLD